MRLQAALSLPWFNQLAGKTMTFPWTNPVFWSLSLICTLLTGLLAGSYPAFYLSSFRPVKVLKGTFNAGKGASNEQTASAPDKSDPKAESSSKKKKGLKKLIPW